MAAAVAPQTSPPTIEEIAAHRLIPVIVIEDADRADALGDALVAGGLPVAEVTFRTAAAPHAIRALAARGDILVGAGTVLTPEHVDQAVAAGAAFLVSPGMSETVVARAQEHGVPIVPGCANASDIMRARAMGLRTVKLFPAGILGGPAAIKALASAFVDMTFIPTGGVSASNVADYLALPAVLAAGGSWMVPAAQLEAGDTAALTQTIAEAVVAAGADKE